MKNNLLIVITLVTFNITSVLGQICGTEITEEHLSHIKKQKNRDQAKISDGLIQIPVKIHIINRSDGTGGIDSTEVLSALNITNDWYFNANMEFYAYESVNFINDDDLFDLERSEEGKVAVPNDVTNVINIYFSNTLNASGNALCGYASFPGGTDRIFMANGCTPNGTTLAHELGHYFGLYHPHEVAFGAELVDGSNCTGAGDKLCSTPADPNLSGKVNSSTCSYTGDSKDANGDFYNPMVSNLMAYSPDVCQDEMTMEQYEKMRRILENDRDYLKLKYSGFAIIINSNQTKGCYPLQVKYFDQSIGTSERSWTFPGGTPSSSTAKDPIIIYETPGIYNASLQIKNIDGDSLSTTKDNYIHVVDPEQQRISTLSILDFENDSIEQNGWNTINENPNVFLQTYPEGNSSTTSLFIENFNNSNLGETEYLISPKVSFEDLSNINFKFDVAYNQFLSDQITKSDTLQIIYKETCSQNWTVLDEYYGSSLAISDGIDTPYNPSSSDWKQFETIFNRNNQNEYESIEIGIRVINSNGNNMYIDNIKLTPSYLIEAPEITSVEQNNQNKNILRWTDNSNNEQGFQIERSIDGGEFEVIGSVSANATVFLDTQNSQIGIYSYKVRATGINDNSDFSDSFNYENIVTGVQVENKFKTRVYPMPFSEFLIIKDETSIESIKIYDSYGRLVFELLANNQPEAKLNLSHLNNGTYLIQVTEASGKTEIFRTIKLD